MTAALAAIETQLATPAIKAASEAGFASSADATTDRAKAVLEERSPSQNTLTLGVNYQWNDQMVVKAEWFRTLANEQNTNTTGPMLARGARIQGINLGVNFVF